MSLEMAADVDFSLLTCLFLTMRILGGVRTEDGRGKGFIRFILILGIGRKDSGTRDA